LSWEIAVDAKVMGVTIVYREESRRRKKQKEGKNKN
jgi:hypothetical protein